VLANAVNGRTDISSLRGASNKTADVTRKSANVGCSDFRKTMKTVTVGRDEQKASVQWFTVPWCTSTQMCPIVAAAARWRVVIVSGCWSIADVGL